MAQVLTRNEAQTLIFNLLDMVYEVAGEEEPKTFEKYMKVGEFDRGQFINYRIAGFQQHTERGDVDDITYDQFEFGESQTINPRDWATGIRISESVIDDLADSGPTESFNRAKLATFSEITRRFRISANWTVENLCTQLFTNFTSTAAGYVGRDALALGSASHVTLKNPTTIWSNLPTAASLSALQLQSIFTSFASIPDDTGNYMPMSMAYTVMVSPYNMIRLGDIIATKGQVDTNNNNTNPLNDYDLTKVINQYLGPSHKGFYVFDKKRATNFWRWRKKPTFSKEGDFDSVSMKMRSVFRGERFVIDPHGIIGNTGA